MERYRATMGGAGRASSTILPMVCGPGAGKWRRLAQKKGRKKLSTIFKYAHAHARAYISLFMLFMLFRRGQIAENSVVVKKYRVEFAFAENFNCVSEWQTLDEWMEIETDTARDAAMQAANADDFEKALFRVFELTTNEFGKLEKAEPHKPEYFQFHDFEIY